MKKLLLLPIITAFLIPGNVLAFDNQITHPRLTDEAIEYSGLREYLVATLNLSDGTETLINGLVIRNWLTSGSNLEDVPQCRASNHFHNPLRNWTESGMRDEPWFVDWWCSGSEFPPENIKSAVHWGTGYVEPAPNGFKEYTGNLWDWDHVREYFYTYLTGNDFQGNLVANTKEQREEYFAKCLQGLGQVLHLLQDMAVPAHVRDDFKSHLEWLGITSETIFKPNEWMSERFEYFVKKHPELITGIVGGNLINPSLTKFWDTNNYTGQDPDSLIPQMIGLAEYTNINFASKNTIFTEDYSIDHVYYQPYPRKSSTNLQEYIDGDLLPETVIGEDNVPDTSFYIKKIEDGEVINHFIKPTYFTKDILQEFGHAEILFYRTFRIDDVCARDYGSKLLPRAVGYSAALLDYFFRGKLQVSSLPIFFQNSIYALRLTIENVTPSEETLTDGHFALVLRYTPVGGTPDGSDDVFVQGWANPQSPVAFFDELQHGDAIEIYFYFYGLIPLQEIENYESITCMLACLGSLGNEEGAVIGKSFTLGEIKFNEEWDNGLTGNYPWTHTTADDNPDNGSTSNVIEDDILIKDNIRYSGHDTPRYNSSYLELVNADHPNGLLITPGTFLQYRINELSINEIPPAPPDVATNWHALILDFNNSLHVQLSQEGQFFYMNPTTAYYSFPLGAVIVDNIYFLFQNAGISIPEPLYLRSIGYIQQLFSLEDPTTATHHQHLEADFIRIIESKQEEKGTPHLGQMGGELKRTLPRQPGQIPPPSSSVRGVPQNAQSGGKIRSINPLTIPAISLPCRSPSLCDLE